MQSYQCTIRKVYLFFCVHSAAPLWDSPHFSHHTNYQCQTKVRITSVCIELWLLRMTFNLYGRLNVFGVQLLKDVFECFLIASTPLETWAARTSSATVDEDVDGRVTVTSRDVHSVLDLTATELESVCQVVPRQLLRHEFAAEVVAVTMREQTLTARRHLGRKLQPRATLLNIALCGFEIRTFEKCVTSPCTRRSSRRSCVVHHTPHTPHTEDLRNTSHTRTCSRHMSLDHYIPCLTTNIDLSRQKAFHRHLKKRWHKYKWLEDFERSA